MLKSTVMSEDDYKSFLRPAIYDSLKAVLKYYGLENASQIYYNGENEIAKLVGSNANDGLRGDMYTDGVFRNKIYIVPEIQQTDFNNGNANQRRQPTERPVWMNDDDHTPAMALYPGFSGVKIEVTVAATFNSSKLAEHYVRRINRLQSNQVTDMAFDATVHMGLNPCLLELFSDVHGLLKKNDPTTLDFGDWFSKFCKVPFTTIMNVAGKHKRLVVPICLTNIGIQFTEPLIARARKGDTSGTFTAEFKYSFYFNEFTHWEIEYPLNVWQDQIPAKWISAPNAAFKRPYAIRVAPETAWINQGVETRAAQAPYYLKLPDHDPWTMPKQSWVQPIVQARLALQDLPTQQLGNIFEIPGFKWNEQVKNYILRRREWAFTQFFTPFVIWVYSDNIRVLPTQLSMDETGMITLNRAPTMQNTYRIVVTLDYAIRDYTNTFWDDLVKNKDDINLLPAIFTWYDWASLPQPWLEDIPRIRREIDKGRGLPFDGTGINRYMMDLGLQAHRLLLVEDLRHVIRN